MLYTIASKIKPQIQHHFELLIDYVINDNLKNEQQLTAALEYLVKHAGDILNEDELKMESGVGVIVNIEDIDKTVKESVQKYKDELLADRYLFNANKLLGKYLYIETR